MKLKPPQVVVLSFFIAITIGTFLLSLPAACKAEGGISLVDRLFTATSATCVTGLIVRDTPNDWAPFGKGVILFLIQIGGIGIMTLSTFFAVLLGRELTLRENVVIQSTLDHSRVYGTKSLIKYIVGLTLLMESIGAAVLFMHWKRIENWTLKENLANSIFHSVSAFCNAGFSLFSDNLVRYRGDVLVNVIIMLLIFLGGIGFIVILDIFKGIFSIREYKKSRFSLQSKLAIGVSLTLIIAGAAIIFALENGNVLKGMPLKDKICGTFFQSVTPRTAGFNTLPIAALEPATLMIIVSLMFIGASPGSTGGGIKTCTFAVIAATTAAMSKNRDKVFLFGRTIPRTIVRRAILIFIFSLTWVFFATFLLAIFEKDNLGHESIVLKSLFEVTSAFGTVGLSMGLTPQLSSLGKIIIIITMFMGRVGSLTLALAVAIKEEKITYAYSEEGLMVG